MMNAGKENKPVADHSRSIKDKRLEFELNQARQQNEGLQSKVDKMLSEPVHLTMEDLADRAKAFEKFRKSYRKNEAMEDNRNLLKEKYARGKNLGADVNNSRSLIKKYSS